MPDNLLELPSHATMRPAPRAPVTAQVVDWRAGMSGAEDFIRFDLEGSLLTIRRVCNAYLAEGRFNGRLYFWTGCQSVTEALELVASEIFDAVALVVL